MGADVQISEAKRKSRLTAAQVKNLPPGEYHDGGGTGLLLRVDETGARLWTQRLMVRGKRREMGLGGYPTVTLAEARDAALENKRLAFRGGDPLAEGRKAKTLPTFAEATKATHAELSPPWKNSKYRDAFLSSLETYIFPSVGRVLLPEVTSGDLRKALLAARAKAPGVARKLTFRCAHVFRWGIAEGHCTANPATAEALALPREERTTQHRKALPYAEVAGCLEVVRASKAWTATKLAIEFVVLTASRSGEARAARWDEIDLHGAPSAAEATSGTWTVPAERMRMKRPHRVPLSAPRSRSWQRPKDCRTPRGYRLGNPHTESQALSRPMLFDSRIGPSWTTPSHLTWRIPRLALCRRFIDKDVSELPRACRFS